MADRLTKSQRSQNMRRIRSKDTAPERIVRSCMHRLGLRFRLHDRSLPGTPDIVLRRHKAVVLVHGCFWHRHAGCHLTYTPQSRRAFWSRKFDANVRRDRKVEAELRKLGWRVVVVWECQTRAPEGLESRIRRLFRLSPTDPNRGNRKPELGRLPPVALSHCIKLASVRQTGRPEPGRLRRAQAKLGGGDA